MTNEIDFCLELTDRLGSAHLPWKITKHHAKQVITNDAATIVAECFDDSGIVPELIMRAINALPEIAVELALKAPARGIGRCCEMLDIQLDVECQAHGKDCPDVVVRELPDGCIGLPIHDGGSSYITINYCPFCGAKL
jgi:hypothetical protein